MPISRPQGAIGSIRWRGFSVRAQLTGPSGSGALLQALRAPLALDPQPNANERERQAHAGREENEIFCHRPLLLRLVPSCRCFSCDLGAAGSTDAGEHGPVKSEHGDHLHPDRNHPEEQRQRSQNCGFFNDGAEGHGVPS